MVIGIIAAMNSELNNLLINLSEVREFHIDDQIFYESQYYNNKIVLTTCGIGKVNSAINTTLLIAHYHPDLIINSGIAGGGEGLKTGEVLIANQFSYSDVDCTCFGYQLGTIPNMPDFFYADETAVTLLKSTLAKLSIKYKMGEVFTADSFRMSKSEIKNSITDNYAVEMEGAAIAQTCYKLKTPFLSIRIISDILDSKDHIENYNSFEEEAGKKASLITLAYLENIKESSN